MILRSVLLACLSRFVRIERLESLDGSLTLVILWETDEACPEDMTLLPIESVQGTPLGDRYCKENEGVPVLVAKGFVTGSLEELILQAMYQEDERAAKRKARREAQEACRRSYAVLA